MNTLTILCLIITALAVGGLLFIILKPKDDKTNASGQALQEKEGQIIALKTQSEFKDKTIEEKNADIARLNKSLEDKSNENTSLFAANKAIKAEYEAKLEAFAQQKEELEKQFTQMQEKTKLEFEKIASQILENKTKAFTDTNKENLEGILNPFKDNLKELKEKVDKSVETETKLHAGMHESIKNMFEQSNTLAKETNSLASALKGGNKTAGSWGENILRTVLEKAGLKEHWHYVAQSAYKDDEQNTLIPDIEIDLPEDRVVIIDSKCSLVAYERYCSAENEEDKQTALKEHLASIKNHINELGGKYNSKQHTLNVALMFVPIEPAYNLAMEKDSSLFDYAWSKDVVLISASNLIVSLKLIDIFWKKEDLNKNLKDIINISVRMYNKLQTFFETFESIGKQIDRTKETYDKSLGQLKTGKGNLIGRAEKLRELGLVANKELPQLFQDYQEEEA
jgi:Uncharacterized protein conserved in bacteria